MIVLASKSPRRKEILKDLDYDFIVCPAKKDEVFDLSLGLDEALKKVAESKAKEVSEFYSDSILYRQIRLYVWMIKYWVSQNQKRMR